MAGPASLSEEQITRIRADVDAGRQPMVWFTPSAVGVDAGRSAKVVAVHEPPDGDFIQARPTGSADVLSFSAAELTLVKPATRRAAKPATDSGRTASPTGAARPAASRAVKADPAVLHPPAGPGEGVDQATAPGARRREPQARSRPPASVTVTITSTPDGEWTVEVMSGARRTVRAQPVSAGAVAQAARALGDDVVSAVDGALAAARERQRAKVERLQAELDAARHVLDDLTA